MFGKKFFSNFKEQNFENPVWLDNKIWLKLLTNISHPVMFT